MRFALLLLSSCLIAAAEDEITKRGFDHYYNLEYDQAIADFEQAARARPNSPEPHNNIAQAILYREMFRNGALESELVTGNNSFLRRPKLNTTPGTEKLFDAEVQKAMDLAQALLNKNPNDTAALYSLGVSNGLKSNYDFLVRKAWKDALREATGARKLHSRVTELDPSNYDARLIEGVHEYVVGSLPWFYRSLGFLAGYHGDRELGIRTLEEVARQGRANKTDAEVLLCALYRREQMPRKAIPLLSDLVTRYPRSYLLKFEQAQMYSAIGDKTNALATLDRIAEWKRAQTPGFANVPWEKIYYEVGNVQFWYRDFGPALENLKKVTVSTKDLDLNTGVLAFMRQGQIYDMTNRHELAKAAYQKAIDFAPQAEAAKESKRYISNPYKRAT
ncbi:MAG: Tetratricopeptide 2 repeat protein [Bryobacterales bacterium]|nr:Tetratricopeptide 2 repeat protein [Bryobacterales bacterium]